MTRLAGGGSAGGVAAGSIDGTGSAAKFYSPYKLCIDTMGTVYVADTENHLVRMISPTGTIIAEYDLKCVYIIVSMRTSYFHFQFYSIKARSRDWLVVGVLVVLLVDRLMAQARPLCSMCQLV